MSPAMNPFSFFRQEVPVTPPVPSNGGSQETRAPAAEESQSEELRHRIAQLEKKVATLTAKKSGPRKTARK
jgi:hypothetical protein